MRDFAFWVFAACVATPVVQSFLEADRSLQRIVYWSSVGVGAAASFFMLYPDPKSGLEFALFFLAFAAFIAYAYTSNIKIGGKIYAFTVQNSQPDPGDGETPDAADPDYDPAPDAYLGTATAAKTWWVAVFAAVICSGNILAFLTSDGQWWYAVGGLTFLIFVATFMGLGDASWGYSVARGQYLQFAVVAIITVGLFPLAYLPCYYLAKHHPVRRKQSMEYRAHPRHRKTE